MGAAFSCCSPAVHGDVAALEQKLDSFLKGKPFIENENHALHESVKLARERISVCDYYGAEDALEKLKLESSAEDKRIAAAFLKFDQNKDDVLQGDEIKYMLDYLGFPCENKDVKALLAVVDADSDETVSLQEFITYVGKMGGSRNLFDLRMQQIEARLMSGSRNLTPGGSIERSALTPRTLKHGLSAIAITEENQHYWELTAPKTELEEAALLKPCQRVAVHHIRTLAKESHDKALPELKQRAIKLGYSEVDLLMALAWVRELAPIIIHFNLEKLGDKFAQDSHYKNQFETHTSGGLLKPVARIKWEKGLFGTAYGDSTPGKERPKYGVQNIWNDPRGVLGCKQYGDSYIILRDVRLRCTMSPEDSANLLAKQLAVPDYYAHVMMNYSDKELKETLRVSKGGDEQLGNSQDVIEKWGKYKEVQIHGLVDFKKHVERLVVPDRLKPKADWVEKIAKAHGWKVTWQSDMKTELKGRASGIEMSKKDWEDRLAMLRKEQEESTAVSNFVNARERLVYWYFSIKEGWQKCDDDCQGRLEAFYQEYLASPSKGTENRELKPGSANGVRKDTLLIDFKKMSQQNVKTKRTRNLKREEVGEL